ncbi:MAG: hypothetical protein PHT27_05805 [Candidatus Izemoplasmatales bacterium]|jgi:hypothetical protein|nr:hypothetical protein [Candidatus Izemoplasmatales bacterium]
MKKNVPFILLGVIFLVVIVWIVLIQMPVVSFSESIDHFEEYENEMRTILEGYQYSLPEPEIYQQYSDEDPERLIMIEYYYFVQLIPEGGLMISLSNHQSKSENINVEFFTELQNQDEKNTQIPIDMMLAIMNVASGKIFENEYCLHFLSAEEGEFPSRDPVKESIVSKEEVFGFWEYWGINYTLCYFEENPVPYSEDFSLWGLTKYHSK